MEKVYLSLGVNFGEREKLLLKAYAMIKQRLSGNIETSFLYESDPWGCEGGVSFYNMAAGIESDLPAEELLKNIHEIEYALGRVRAKPAAPGEPGCERIYQPRTMDIDILFYGSKIISAKDLIIPHPLLHERRFALVPMAQIAPCLVHPVFKKTIKELLASCKDTGRVKRLT